MEPFPKDVSVSQHVEYSLDSLPSELLLEIVDFDHGSIKRLSVVSSYFYHFFEGVMPPHNGLPEDATTVDALIYLSEIEKGERKYTDLWLKGLHLSYFPQYQKAIRRLIEVEEGLLYAPDFMYQKGSERIKSLRNFHQLPPLKIDTGSYYQRWRRVCSSMVRSPYIMNISRLAMIAATTYTIWTILDEHEVFNAALDLVKSEGYLQNIYLYGRRSAENMDCIRFCPHSITFHNTNPAEFCQDNNSPVYLSKWQDLLYAASSCRPRTSISGYEFISVSRDMLRSRCVDQNEGYIYRKMSDNIFIAQYTRDKLTRVVQMVYNYDPICMAAKMAPLPTNILSLTTLTYFVLYIIYFSSFFIGWYG